MQHKPFGLYEKYIKRPQDFLCALLATIVLSPILLVVAILVRVKLGAPVLFTQDRPGRYGKIFKLYKFRTMLPPKDGIIDPTQDAARLTPFGRKLRSTSLDELPELFNMLKGSCGISPISCLMHRNKTALFDGLVRCNGLVPEESYLNEVYCALAILTSHIIPLDIALLQASHFIVRTWLYTLTVLMTPLTE